MITKLFIPGPPLDRYVTSFYFYEGYNPNHSIDCFLPNGETEMIIDLTEIPKYIYDRDTLKEIQACNHVWVSGVRTEPICIPSGKDSRMMIINFRKGCGHPFYPMPLREMTDYVLDADLLYGYRIADLRSRMLEAKTIDQLFILTEEFLIATAGDKLNGNIKEECIRFMIGQLENAPSQMTLEELSLKIGYSQKHLISLFKDRVGVTPKMFMRLLRFQQVICEIEKCNKHDWIQVAYSCGYYDQAHFIRDFKTFSGFTPTAYSGLKTDLLNYIPVR